MLVWTRWGIAIPFLGYLGFLAGVELAIAIGQQLQTNASWLMASGQTVGALLASLLVMIFEDWRSTRGGEKRSRTLINEATGERIAADDPGDTFFGYIAGAGSGSCLWLDWSASLSRFPSAYRFNVSELETQR